MINPSFLRRSKKDPAVMNANSIMLSIVFYLVFGILLVILKETAMRICAYALAALLILLGGYELFTYIGSPAIRKVTESRLAVSLICLLSGAMLAFSPDYLGTVLPVIWGLSLLFGAFLKIQYAFDQLSLKIKKWWMMLIFAAVSLAIGILALTSKTDMDDQKYLFIGIMLILEAVLDVVVFFLMNRALKKLAVFSDSVLVPEDKVAPVVPAVQQEVSDAEEAKTEK